MTGAGTSSNVTVEVTYDPGGRLRWPVRIPLSTELSALPVATQLFPEFTLV